jgi:serine protease
VAIVASAGNDAMDVDSPANCTGVVAVGGLRHIGTKSGYSSLGSAVTISAPAGNCVNETGACLYPITSTSNTGTTTPSCPTYTGTGSDAAVGTSFSAPLVAATLALMRSANPSLDPDGLTSLLRSSARAFPTTGAGSGIKTCTAPGTTEQLECYCTTSTCGAGMLDAGAAVTAAAAGRTVANLQEGSALLLKGASTLLSASNSQAATGATLSGYAWSLTDTSLATLNGTTTSSTASLTASASGDVLLRLLVTDSAGGTATARAVIRTGTAADSSCEVVSSTTSEDSGGGALAPTELGLGLLALAALVWARRRPH